MDSTNAIRTIQFVADIKTQPQIMQDSMMAGQRWGQRIGRAIEEEARRELKRRGVDL